MSVAVCPICHRPSPNSSCCQACISEFEEQLRRLPGLVRELEVTVLRQSRINTGEKVRSSGSGVSPILFHPVAAGIRDDLSRVLHKQVRAVEEYLPATSFDVILSEALRARAGRLGKLAVVLRLALPGLRSAPFLSGLIVELAAQVGRVVRVIDLPADRTHFSVGPCHGRC
mgnify:CR=1 FL=1